MSARSRGPRGSGWYLVGIAATIAILVVTILRVTGLIQL